MGPLILLMFAGHLGWSAMMGNATANDTNCHNATQPQGNMTCNNMTMPMKNETHPPHNVTMPPKNETHPPHNVTMPPKNETHPPHNVTMPPKNETHPPHNVTMPPPVTKPAPPPAPTMNVKFKLQKNFTADLKDPSSPAFKKLETEVAGQLDAVYSKKFGPAFNKTVIKGFSQGSVKVDAELVFNNASDLPEASQVASTLVEAASSGNFSLSVNTSSIEAEVVTPKAEPTTAAPVTPKESVTTSADATLGLVFSLTQTFTSELTNKSSSEYKALETTVLTELDVIGKKLYGSSFTGAVINSFKNGSVVVDSTLKFSNQSSVPTASDATSQLSSSLTNSSLKVVAGSISATSNAAAATAAAKATAAVTTSADATLGLVFSLIQTFTSELANSSSSEYKALETTVVKELDVIGNKLYGSSFTGSVINSFKNGSVVVDSTLKFTNKSSVPTASVATSQLSSSLTNSSLKVVAGSVTATSNAAAATAAPNATTASASGLSTDPPSSSEGTLSLLFTLIENYTSDLGNSSSSAFKALATVVLTEVNSICTRLFGSSFRRSILNSFKSGSVKVDLTLVYKDKDSVPSASNATSLLSEALMNSSVLKVVNGSVSAQSTASSGCQSPPSVLALLASSLALVAAAQTLIRF